MRVHFIAVGGSAMHNLAIALHKKGFTVSGSDDEIFEPALSRLKNLGLLPDSIGWDARRITGELDAVILGMHAKIDNPELIKAKELGLRIFSYPEYLYDQSKDKTRIVIGGSHGKTTITAMILHVMRLLGMETDYMVGAQLEGFDVMVKLSHEAPYMVFEGDEYLTSAIDSRPKFHLYQPHIALISGIAWDHINVFPTFENYIDQFRIFAEMVPADGTMVYCEEDDVVKSMMAGLALSADRKPYGLPHYYIEKGQTFVTFEGKTFALAIFGRHNMMNMEGARRVLESIGVKGLDFYEAIQSFKGASKRLELVSATDDSAVYKDFAHSPSKLKATIEAVKAQFPERHLIACMELHTYSSLNTEFLKQYAGCMDRADTAVVYYNRHALEIKKLPFFDREVVLESFNKPDLQVFNDSEALVDFLKSKTGAGTNILMMSSGDFDGINLKGLANGQ